MNDISERARRAQAAKTKTPFSVKFSHWYERQSLQGLFFVAFQLAMLIALTAYEAFNSASGWAMIAKGAAPGWLAALFGFGLTIGYIGYHRQASERLRVDNKSAAVRAGIVAVFAALLALFGVFSNLSSKTALAATSASELNLDRADIRADIRLLESEVTPENIANTEALVDVTRRQIKSLEGEAVGWGMDETTPEACAADLRQRQRQICNSLNGAGDGSTLGLRNELRLNEAALENLRSKAERLETLRAQAANLRQQEGAEHWEAMSRVSMGNVDASSFRIWGTFLASILVLIVVGFGWDAFFERREEELGIDDEGEVR